VRSDAAAQQKKEGGKKMDACIDVSRHVVLFVHKNLSLPGGTRSAAPKFPLIVFSKAWGIFLAHRWSNSMGGV
jgi:hypothetical protein